jgi:hypothetical protein
MSKSGSENGDAPHPGAGPEVEPEVVLELEQGSEMDSEVNNEVKSEATTLVQQQRQQPAPAPTFKALERLIVSSDDLLPAGPVGVEYGVLENGLHYYVRKNAKPRERAALALGVKVG